jgi:hypothetical protein
MQNLVVKLKESLSKIEAERGKFEIKCLVSKKIENIQWDLILSASWFEEDQMKRLNYLSEKIMKSLTIDEIIEFSGISTLASDSDMGKFLLEVMNGHYNKYGSVVRAYDSFTLIETRHPLAPLIVCL